MKAYIVTCNLNSPGENYADLWEAFKSYGYYWNMQGPVWIIGTESSARQIRDHLTACLERPDTLFVGRLREEAAWFGIEDQGNEWLRELLSSSMAYS